MDSCIKSDPKKFFINDIWLIPTYGHADRKKDPSKKDHFKKVVMNGAECSE